MVLRSIDHNPIFEACTFQAFLQPNSPHLSPILLESNLVTLTSSSSLTVFSIVEALLKVEYRKEGMIN